MSEAETFAKNLRNTYSERASKKGKDSGLMVKDIDVLQKIT